MRDADHTRAESADALPASMADARIGHAVRATCPDLFGAGLESCIRMGRENSAPLRSGERGDIVERGGDRTDENARTLGPRGVSTLARKGHEMERHLGDRRLQHRGSMLIDRRTLRIGKTHGPARRAGHS